MASKRKKRYYDSYQAIKAYQHVTNIARETVHDWEVEDMMVNNLDHIVNRRKRSRVGHLETRKRR